VCSESGLPDDLSWGRLGYIRWLDTAQDLCHSKATHPLDHTDFTPMEGAGRPQRGVLGDVQQSIIDAEAEGAVLLGDEHDRETPFRRCRFDDVRFQLPLDFGRLGLPCGVPRTVRREPDGPGSGVEVDAVLGGFGDAQRLARPHRLVLAQHASNPGVQCRVGIREVHVLHVDRGHGRCATRRGARFAGSRSRDGVATPPFASTADAGSCLGLGGSRQADTAPTTLSAGVGEVKAGTADGPGCAARGICTTPVESSST